MAADAFVAGFLRCCREQGLSPGVTRLRIKQAALLSPELADVLAGLVKQADGGLGVAADLAANKPAAVATPKAAPAGPLSMPSRASLLTGKMPTPAPAPAPAPPKPTVASVKAERPGFWGQVGDSVGGMFGRAGQTIRGATHAVSGSLLTVGADIANGLGGDDDYWGAMADSGHKSTMAGLSNIGHQFSWKQPTDAAGYSQPGHNPIDKNMAANAAEMVRANKPVLGMSPQTAVKTMYGTEELGNQAGQAAAFAGASKLLPGALAATGPAATTGEKLVRGGRAVSQHVVKPFLDAQAIQPLATIAHSVADQVPVGGGNTLATPVHAIGQKLDELPLPTVAKAGIGYGMSRLVPGSGRLANAGRAAANYAPWVAQPEDIATRDGLVPFETVASHRWDRTDLSTPEGLAQSGLTPPTPEQLAQPDVQQAFAKKLESLSTYVQSNGGNMAPEQLHGAVSAFNSGQGALYQAQTGEPAADVAVRVEQTGPEPADVARAAQTVGIEPTAEQATTVQPAAGQQSPGQQGGDPSVVDDNPFTAFQTHFNQLDPQSQTMMIIGVPLAIIGLLGGGAPLAAIGGLLGAAGYFGGQPGDPAQTGQQGGPEQPAGDASVLTNPAEAVTNAAPGEVATPDTTAASAAPGADFQTALSQVGTDPVRAGQLWSQHRADPANRQQMVQAMLRTMRQRDAAKTGLFDMKDETKLRMADPKNAAHRQQFQKATGLAVSDQEIAEIMAALQAAK